MNIPLIKHIKYNTKHKDKTSIGDQNVSKNKHVYVWIC